MGDDAAQLYQDMQFEREKYDSRALELVEELMHRRRELAPEERALLDLAVLDFNRKLPPAAAPKKVAPKKLELKEEEPELEEPAGDPIPGVDIPMGSDKPFWWL